MNEQSPVTNKGVSKAYVDAGDAAISAAIAALPSKFLVGTGYMDANAFGSGVVSGDITSMSTDGAGNYIVNFNDQGGIFGLNFGAHVTVCSPRGDGSQIWNIDVGGFDSASLFIATSVFNPGILGVALPSWDLTAPVGITVTLYRIF